MCFLPLTPTACSLVAPTARVVVVPTSSASVLKVILNGRTWAMVGREKGKCFYILTEFDNTLWSDCMVFVLLKFPPWRIVCRR